MVVQNFNFSCIFMGGAVAHRERKEAKFAYRLKKQVADYSPDTVRTRREREPVRPQAHILSAVHSQKVSAVGATHTCVFSCWRFHLHKQTDT